MRTNFDEFMDELEAEAKTEGPRAVAQLRAFGEHFASAAARIDSPHRKRKGYSSRRAVTAVRIK